MPDAYVTVANHKQVVETGTLYLEEVFLLTFNLAKQTRAEYWRNIPFPFLHFLVSFRFLLSSCSRCFSRAMLSFFPLYILTVPSTVISDSTRELTTDFHFCYLTSFHDNKDHYLLDIMFFMRLKKKWHLYTEVSSCFDLSPHLYTFLMLRGLDRLKILLHIMGYLRGYMKKTQGKKK